MELLNSPLKKADFDQIDSYFNAYKSNFLKLDIKELSIEKFKTDFKSFDKYLINLSDAEKARAWLYLYSKVTKYLKDQTPVIQPNKQFDNLNSRKLASYIVSLVILAMVGWGIHAFLNREESPEEKAKKRYLRTVNSAEIAVSSVLKDPYSAVFRNQRGFCGEVNSKNSFGAYTGYVRYIAPKPDLIVLESTMDQSEFEEVWNKLCK